MLLMTLYLDEIDVKLQAHLVANNKGNWTHLQFVQLSLNCTQIKTYDKEYQPKVLSQAQCTEVAYISYFLV